MSANILVVDDEPDLEALILQKFRHQIRAGKINFLFARDGVEALSLLSGRRDVDMVLSDINMPRMDGLTLLQELQSSNDKLTTIIVSAYGDMSNIRTAMNCGAFDFVTKPIDFTDLETTIGKTIRHIEILREARHRQLVAERAHASLARYFSPNLAERLANAEGSLDLVGQRREVAAVFTDIANFTSLVETIEPDKLTSLLNEYLGGATDIVFGHEGTVAKIVGDALHILFGAPGDQPDHASRAVACALDLDRFSQDFRKRWRQKDISLGKTRIGVHAGVATVGNFGGGRFFDYTAYGDTINIASRLESANKQLGTRVCVSEAIMSRIPDFKGRVIGDLILRGRREPLRAFEPLTAKVYSEPATEAYAQAFAKLVAGDPATMPAFAALVGMRPDDRLVSFHLKRLLNGASGPRIELP